MHTMDNETVSVGDSVFGVGYGVGKVVELLSEGKFRVAFAVTGQTLTFTHDGRLPRSLSRSLYWKDPVVVPPSKDDNFWLALRPAIEALVVALRPIV